MANIDDKDIQKAAQPQFQPRRAGTGFTNVQRILGANAGNRLGQTIAQGVGQVAQQAQQNLGSTAQQFQQKAQQGLIGTGQAQQRAQSVVGAQDVDTAVQAAQNDPTLYKDFATYRSGQYKGPKSLSDVTDQSRLMGQAREAEQLGQASTTQGGRAQLLQRFAGGPQYTRGQRELDALLLGREPLSGVRRQTTGIIANTERQAANAEALAKQIESQNQAFAQQVNQGLTGIQSKFQGGLEARKAQTLQQQQDFLNRVQGAFAVPQTSDIELTAEDAAKLGLTGGQQIGALSANDLQLMGVRPDVSLQEVATPEEVAKYKVLQGLAGQEGGYLSEDASTLGSYSKALQEGQKIDPRRVQAALETARQRFDEQARQYDPELRRLEDARITNEELMKGIRQGGFYNVSGRNYGISDQPNVSGSMGNPYEGYTGGPDINALNAARQQEAAYAKQQHDAIRAMLDKLREQSLRKVRIKE